MNYARGPGPLGRFVLRHVMASSAPVYAHEIAKALREESPRVNAALRTLDRAGLVVRIVRGVYASPETAERLRGQPLPKVWRGTRREGSNASRALILVQESPGEVAVSEIAAALRVEPTSAASAIAELYRAGEIRRVRWGVYERIQKSA